MGVGGALLAVGALKALELTELVPPLVYHVLIGAGLFGISVGILFLVRAIDNPLPGSISYEAREAKRTELRTIWEFAREELPECPSWNATKRHYNKTPDGFHLVERVIETRWWSYRSVVGFFTIVPVNDDGIKGLLEGSEFQEVFIAASFRSNRAKGLYVGSIAARGVRARGEALGYLRGSLRQLTGSGLRMVFTRPITTDGLRLAHHHDFSPVNSEADETELGLVYFRHY